MPAIATIELRYSSGDLQTLTLGPGTHRIGREHGTVVIPDHRISAIHGELCVDDTGLLYRDLGSSNGSFTTRGQKLEAPLRVTVGNGVRLGDTVVQLIAFEGHASDATRADSPARRKPVEPTLMMAPGLAMAASGPAVGGAPSSQGAARVGLDRTPQAGLSAQSAAGAGPIMGAAAAPFEDAESAATAAEDVWQMHAGRGAPPSAGGGAQPDEDGDRHDLALRPRPAGDEFESVIEDAKYRLIDTWQLLEAHWQPIAKLIGTLTVPFAAARIVLSYLPIAGDLLGALLSVVEAGIFGFFIHGIVAQYCHRLSDGGAGTVQDARLAHSQRLGPWSITVLLSGLLIGLGFGLLIVPGIILSWGAVPAFVLHNQQGLDAGLRSGKLFVADWKYTSRGLVGLAAAGLAYSLVIRAIETALPGLALDEMVGALGTCIMVPFSTLYSFQLYRDAWTRSRHLLEVE